MTPSILSTNEDMLSATVDLAGLTVVDVGCGDGHYTRFMAAEGADVIGIECSKAQLERARRMPAVSTELYRFGVGEDLPARPGTADLITFFYSLHHVPIGSQMKALLDAAQALKADGMIYVAEPLAEGPSYEFFKPVDDEAEVRGAAFQAIKDAASVNLIHVKELRYNTMDVYWDYDEVAEEAIRISPDRLELLDRLRPEMLRRFETYSTPLEDGSYGFVQPVRVNLLRKIL